MLSTAASRTRSLRRGGFVAVTLALAGTIALAGTFAHADPAPASTPSGALQPPTVSILKATPGRERGLIFVAPKTTPATGLQQGPEIVDDEGRPVWFRSVPDGQQATDFRVQRYRGEPVLTWWQGVAQPGRGQGTDYIVDRAYHVVATVRAGNGLDADLHEFRLTPEGTALITIYHQVPRDLSAVGGPADGSVFEGVVQEIDVATGAVKLEWHSLDHVPLDESQAPVPTAAGAAYDYFHVNAVNVDRDGNLLVDARNTWTVYKIDRHTGEVLWRLGGKQSSFALGDGAAFAWQHDPEPVDRTTIRLFDNEASPTVRAHSRIIWLRREPWTHTATLVRSFEHPDGLSAGSQGNAQALDNGNTFVGWGQTGRFSELDGSGNLLFDASVPASWDNYRAYRHEWHARPAAAPTATVARNADGTLTVHAIWNGATDVARWLVVGDYRRYAWPLGTADWNGLDTSIQLTTGAAEISVVAVDRAGHVLGRSAPVATGS
jgi:hypothetical protein